MSHASILSRIQHILANSLDIHFTILINMNRDRGTNALRSRHNLVHRQIVRATELGGLSLLVFGKASTLSIDNQLHMHQTHILAMVL
jgi:hypothetical protein